MEYTPHGHKLIFLPQSIIWFHTVFTYAYKNIFHYSNYDTVVSELLSTRNALATLRTADVFSALCGEVPEQYNEHIETLSRSNERLGELFNQMRDEYIDTIS